MKLALTGTIIFFNRRGLMLVKNAKGAFFTTEVFLSAKGGSARVPQICVPRVLFVPI